MAGGDLLFRLLLETCTDRRRGHRGTDMARELCTPPPSGPALGSDPLGAGLRDPVLRAPSPMGAPEPGSRLVSPRGAVHTRGCPLSSGLEATGSACSGLAFDADVPPGRSFMEQEGGDVTSAT